MADPFVIPRPRLVFRVGVTGARKLPPAQQERLEAEISDILRHLRDTVETLSQRDEAAVYAPQGDAPLLRLVSPLAEGADRRVARQARDLHYELFAPLPFPQGVYEEDFPETLEAFRDLLPKGKTFELDGQSGAFAPESYREVGRFVVRNCDLLIALWDGERESGPGGTAEIVRFARGARVPIWRIDPSGREAPSFVEGPLEPVFGETAKANLDACIASTLLPPKAPGHGTHHGFFVSLARGLETFCAKRRAPLDEYLAETAPAYKWRWRLYAAMTRRIAPPGASAGPQLAAPANDPERWWDANRRAADAASMGQADRYRSSYVWIALFAFLAFFGAALSFVLPHALRCFGGGEIAEAALLVTEIGALLGIAYAVISSHMQRWHEKWIAYRLLAELCRKQYALAAMGHALPVSEAFRAAEPQDAPRDAWVAWWFAALQRAAPVPTGGMAAAKSHARDLALSLVAEQIDYHGACEKRWAQAADSLETLGEWAFLGACVLTAFKFAAFAGLPDPEEAMHGFGAAAIIVSAASASLVGVRAYSEFAVLARQSAQMRRALTQAKAELERLDLASPFAGRELGRLVYSVALLMLQDVGGWVRLFRMKALEAA